MKNCISFLIFISLIINYNYENLQAAAKISFEDLSNNALSQATENLARIEKRIKAVIASPIETIDTLDDNGDSLLHSVIKLYANPDIEIWADERRPAFVYLKAYEVSDFTKNINNLLQVLFDNRINPNMRNKSGQTPLDLAKDILREKAPDLAAKILNEKSPAPPFTGRFGSDATDAEISGLKQSIEMLKKYMSLDFPKKEDELLAEIKKETSKYLPVDLANIVVDLSKSE